MFGEQRSSPESKLGDLGKQLLATETELRGEQGDIVMAANSSPPGAWILAGRVELAGQDPKSRFTSLKTLLQ
jgi:hypothetical protein